MDIGQNFKELPFCLLCSFLSDVLVKGEGSSLTGYPLTHYPINWLVKWKINKPIEDRINAAHKRYVKNLYRNHELFNDLFAKRANTDRCAFPNFIRSNIDIQRCVQTPKNIKFLHQKLTHFNKETRISYIRPKAA